MITGRGAARSVLALEPSVLPTSAGQA
jgi:hypothetical protein